MAKKINYVYKITNVLNGMEYIGVHSTNNIDDGYMGSGTYLKYAIKKHGIVNFKKEILEYHNDRVSALESERKHVHEDYVVKDSVYNLVTGGGGIRPLLKSVEFKYDFIGVELPKAQYKKDIDSNFIRLYVDSSEKQIQINRLNHIKEHNGDNNNTLGLRVHFSLFLLNNADEICETLTNYWNDKRFHKYALNVWKLMINSGISDVSNNSVIRIGKLEAA